MSVDNSAEIQQLKQLINSSVESVSADGLSTTLSIEQARKRLIELEAQQSGRRMVRPRITGIDISGCFN